MACIKLKKLEEYLQCLDDFEKPKVVLEQYPTPPHIASQILYSIQTVHDDIENKVIADLGCGCGMLSIGSMLLGAANVVGFEIDPNALTVFQNNINEMEIPGIEFVNCDVTRDVTSTKFGNYFDTVIMNPPFGTKNNEGIDMKFLEVAQFLSNNVVYSLHKTSTRKFIQKTAESSEWNVDAKVIAELKYDLPATFKFHKKSSVDINVDLWRCQKRIK